MSVSVVVTCYNQAGTIEQAVRSVEAQSAFDQICQILVVNDGSRDASRDVLEQLAGDITRLRIIETAGLGSAAARNCALREAEGEFIALLDGDDYWTPDKLARHLPAFERDTNIGLVYGDFVEFSREDASDARTITVRRFDPRTPHHLRDYFLHDGPIVPSTIVLSRSALEVVGLFDETIGICEDTEFCLRLAERRRFCHVPGALTFKRRHPAQTSHRIDSFFPNFVLLTQRYSARYPELAPLAHRRLARCHVKVSADCATKGERRKAARHGVTAVRLAPFYWRAWANLLLLPAPALVVQRLSSALKMVWHTFRLSWRGA